MKTFTTKTNWKKALKHIRTRKTFAAGFIKKKGNSFSIILICLLLLTMNYSGKRLKHSFQTRGITNYKLNLLKKMVLQDDDLIAKELNKFFKNAVSTLNIKENRIITNRSSKDISNPIDKAIDKYKFHPRIILIRKHLKNHDIISFKRVEIDLLAYYP